MTTSSPLVAIVGGPDVDARIPLMNHLSDRYSFFAVGSSMELQTVFQSTDYPFRAYPLPSGANPINNILAMCHLRRLFQDVKPSIVHTFDTKPSALGRIAAIWAHVPIIIGTLPGLGSLYASDGLKTRVIRAIYEPLQQYASHRSSWTVFQNHDDLHVLRTKGVVRVSNSSVILGSGVDTERYREEAVKLDEIIELRRELGITPDSRVILMISRLIRTKGVLQFAEAALTIRSQYPKWHFVLVGARDDSSLDRLSNSEMAFLEGQVLWLGVRQDVKVLLAMSDIFVLPTFYREGIPRVLLEAAAMGRALITTDSPGCNEVVVDGENGYLVPPNNSEPLVAAIIRMVEMPELRAEFGYKSRQRAERLFSLKVVAQQTDDLYQRLISDWSNCED